MSNNLIISVKLNADGGVLNAVLKDAKGNLTQLGAVGKQAGDSINTGISSARAGVVSISTQLQRMKNELIGLAGLSGLSALAKQFIDSADKVNELNSRLKLATKSEQEYTAAKAELIAISQRTGTSLASNIELYAKTADSFRAMGRSQQEALQFTEATAQAMRISGGTSQSAAAGVLQLTQALGSGVLRGDEFNTMMESSPRMAQALADGLGVPIGALRSMAEEGKLTADVVTKAIISQRAALSGEFAQLPITVGQSYTRLTNAMMLWVEQADASAGISAKLSGILNFLANNVNAVAGAATALGQVALAGLALRYIPAVLAAVKALYASVSLLYLRLNQPIGTVMPGAIGSIGKLQAASNLLMSAWMGWEIGSLARENFEVVRLAGVKMAEGIHVALAWLSGASKSEIQAIRDGYTDVFKSSTDKAQQASTASVAASAAAVAKTKAQLEEESAAYKALTTTIKANYDQRLADLSANLQQQLALIDATETNETAKESAKTAAILVAHQERLSAIKTYQTEVLALIDQEQKARLSASKASGESEKQINLDALNARRAALADILKDYQAHFNDLAGQYSAHLAHVQQIEQAKRDAVAGVEASLREMARETMSARGAYEDKLKEVRELRSQAQKALDSGDYESALKYSKQSIELAKQTKNAVVEGDDVIIDKRSALMTANTEVTKSADLMKRAFDGQGAAAQKEADKTAQAMKATGVSVTELKASIAALDQQLASQHALTIKTNVDEVKASISSLNGMNTSSTHTITIKKVEANATGGLVGAGIGRYATGGPVTALVRKFAAGGPVFKRPNWLKVPGSGNGDTEPAALEGGSYVVKKSASRYYGDGLMGAIARGVRKFAGGGFATPVMSAFFNGTGDDFTTPENESDIAKKIAVIRRAAGLIDSYNRRFNASADWIGDGIGRETLLAASRGDKNAERQVEEFYKKSIAAAADVAEYMGRGTTGVKDVWALLGIPKMATARNTLIDRYGVDPKGYAAGGPSGTDTVPAMLTPGEWVVKKSAVAKYGLGFLDALNNMRIPRAALAGIGSAPVARFAGGGLVGERGVMSSSVSETERAPSTTTITNHISFNGFTGSDDDVRRKIIPAINKIMGSSR